MSQMTASVKQITPHKELQEAWRTIAQAHFEIWNDGSDEVTKIAWTRPLFIVFNLESSDFVFFQLNIF